MLTWKEEAIVPNTGQISENKVILAESTGGMQRYLDVIDRRASWTEECVVKTLCAPIAEQLKSYRLDTHLQVAKLMQKRSAPVRNAGFYNTCKLNLRNAP
jgi:hypothetical protein